MKNSETDKEFFDLIKNTLGNYEEQYILGSWENYVKKRNKRRKIIFWRIGTGIAACLLLGWLGFRLIPSGPLGNSVNPSIPSDKISNVVMPEVKATPDTSVLIQQVTSIKKEANILSSKASGDRPTNSTGSGLRNIVTENSPDSRLESKAASALNAISESDINTADSHDEQNLPENLQAVLPVLPNSNVNSKAVPETGRSDSSEYKPIFNQTDPLISSEKDITNLRAENKFRFGINISPGVTSTTSASSFNYSGGINAEYALFHVFRLSTGLQFEHLRVVNSEQASDPSVPQGETKAELIDVDIPFNITWKFLVRKSISYYVSSGISSVVYLSENYANTSYAREMVGVVEVKDGRPNLTYQMEAVKTTQKTTAEPLNTFDFASRVNIIFGFEQHLSSKLFLHVEPYIKIPLSEQAAQNIKYTTGGISCKISF